MPMIHLEYDNKVMTEKEATLLSVGIQQIVSEVTKIEDVFVYGNTSQIKIKIAPVEIFIRMSDYKVKDEKALSDEIKSRLSEWKSQSNFKHPINMTLIPIHWIVEVGI